MKPTRIFLFITVMTSFLISSPLQAAGKSDSTNEKTLNVYCYDSFSSEWGAGPDIAEEFYRETGISVVYNAPGDGVTVLNQLILEKGKTRGDVVVGLDSSLLDRVLNAGILDIYKSPALETVPQELLFDETWHLLPYDYGHFAICYDSELIENPPNSLEELCAEKYSDALILMDPRTSTPGLGFLLWTVAVYGSDWPDYWQRLKPSILTITDGWSQGYTLFTAGEAPMVLSYGTSPVYHAEYENNRRYRAAEFREGHIMQIEGMGILKGTENHRSAKLFIDFMLGEYAQKTLALKNIMFPANGEVILPESFETALHPAKSIQLPKVQEDAGGETGIENIITRWTGVFSR